MRPGQAAPLGAQTRRPEAVTVRAADGYALGAYVWRLPESAADGRSVVIVNAATSVRCDYYARFAQFLFDQGFDVITYDYRGIGASRPRTLRGFQASWIDWGRLDFEAVLQYALRAFTGQPIDVVAHSIGGFLIGFAPSSARIRRIVTMGAQHAYWRDYAPQQRYRMLVKWHWFMPAMTALFGYFPGRTLGWLEDTPRGVVRDWSRAGRRFEPARRSCLTRAEATALMKPFSAVTAATLALSVTDDEFGTVPAVERLLGYFPHSPATHLRIAPARIAASQIGHFAFFHERHAASLWQIPLEWLRQGRCPADVPGVIVPRGGPRI
ncbi:MAG TPA: alpha/beta fold hydrolase [Burkholderiaceae bacterium]|nr:alpha/beta fold hydrolase [Burkholderiaceae bacterium]